jgi:hypothetical protein
LRYSVLSWTNAADDSERLSSFAPLVFSPEEPARQFAAWAAGLSIEVRLRLEAALAEVIETWSPRMDANAAALLIDLAAYVGSPYGAAPVLDLLAKPIKGSEIERRDVAEAVAFFGRQRSTPAEARMLAYKLREAELRAPTAAIVLLARAASRYDVEIIEDLKILAPDVLDNDPRADQHAVSALRRFAVNTFVDILGAEQAYKLALRAQSRDAPELCDAFRRWRFATKTISKKQMRLRDKLTWLESILDVSDIPEIVLTTSASELVIEKRIAITAIDRQSSQGASK